jgi:hypothetical protein
MVTPQKGFGPDPRPGTRPTNLTLARLTTNRKVSRSAYSSRSWATQRNHRRSCLLMARNIDYFRLDAGLFDHPKFIALLDEPDGDRLLGEWLRLALLARRQADPEKPAEAGIITRGAARKELGRDRGEQVIDSLCRLGLIDELLDGTWLLHDFADHQDLTGWAKRQQRNKQGGQARATQAAAAARVAAQGQPRLDPDDSLGSSLGYSPGPSAGSALTQPNPTETPNGVSGGRATRLPRNWEPSRDLIRWAATTVPDVNAAWETDKFRDYWHAKSGQGATKTDWDATWKNWMRKASEDGGTGPPRSRTGGREQIEGEGWR